MGGEAGNGHHEVEIASELVDLPHVAGDEGRSAVKRSRKSGSFLRRYSRLLTA